MAINIKKPSPVKLAGTVVASATSTTLVTQTMPKLNPSGDIFREDTAALYEAAASAPTNSGKIMAPEGLHKLRLERAALMVKGFTPKGCTIVDFGCGMGDLFPLISQERVYLGLDPNEKFIQHCRQTYHEGPWQSFRCLGLPTPNHDILGDYGVCLGVTAHLVPGITALEHFARYITRNVRSGVIIEFQDAERYKGKFTSHTMDMVIRAFNYKPKGENILSDPEDSTFTAFFPL